MVLENLIKVQFGPLEQFLARRKYKTFVLDGKIPNMATTSASEGDLSSDDWEQDENTAMKDKHVKRMKQRLFEQLKGHECPQQQAHLESLITALFKPRKNNKRVELMRPEMQNTTPVKMRKKQDKTKK